MTVLANPLEELDTAIVLTPRSQSAHPSLGTVVHDIQPCISKSFSESTHLEIDDWAFDGAIQEDESFWSLAIETACQDELDMTNDSNIIDNQDQGTLKSLGSTIAMSELSTVLSGEHHSTVTAVEEAQQRLNDVVRELAYAISEARVNQLTQDLVVLKSEHHSLREHLDKMTQGWSDHEANLQAVRYEVQQTKVELTSTRAINDTMARDLSITQGTLAERDTQLDLMRSELTAGRERHTALEKRLLRTETCLTHMKQSLGELDQPTD